MHNVAHSPRSNLVEEMAHVTTPHGLVVILEHNPLNPLTRLAVSRCDFDEDVILLSKRATKRLFRTHALSVMDEAYILFFPWSFPGADRFEALLGVVPLGAQYFVAGRRS